MYKSVLEGRGYKVITVPDGATGIAIVDDRSVVISFGPRDHQLSVPFYGAKLQLKVNARDKLMWQSEAESSRWLKR